MDGVSHSKVLRTFYLSLLILFLLNTSIKRAWCAPASATDVTYLPNYGCGCRWGLPDDKDNESTRDWREIVKGRFLLDKNWLNGQYHISTLRGHTGWYALEVHPSLAEDCLVNCSINTRVTCVDFYANKLVSSSYDGTVRIWNTQTGKTSFLQIRTLQ